MMVTSSLWAKMTWPCGSTRISLRRIGACGRPSLPAERAVLMNADTYSSFFRSLLESSLYVDHIGIPDWTGE